MEKNLLLARLLLCCFIDHGMTWSICISAWKSSVRHRWFRWIVTHHFTVTCFTISTFGEHGDTWHSCCRMRSSVQLCKLTMSFRGQNKRTILLINIYYRYQVIQVETVGEVDCTRFCRQTDDRPPARHTDRHADSSIDPKMNVWGYNIKIKILFCIVCSPYHIDAYDKVSKESGH